MKKTLSLNAIALVTVVILIGLASTTYAIEPGTEHQQGVIVVKNPNGESLGIVTNALVDSSGNVAFIIVGILDEMGQGKKEIAVPSIIFAYDGQSKTLLLNMTKEQLAAGPEFKESELSDPSYAGSLYRYYGLVPPWTEGATEDETE